MREPDDIDQLEQEYWEDLAEAESLWKEEETKITKNKPIGNLPYYNPGTTLQERLAICIEHELYHGGNHLAAAAAIIRDMKWGYLKHTPISVSDRMPGPEDCDSEGRCWWEDRVGIPKWVFTSKPYGMNSWLPYWAIQTPEKKS